VSYLEDKILCLVQFSEQPLSHQSSIRIDSFILSLILYEVSFWQSLNNTQFWKSRLEISKEMFSTCSYIAAANTTYSGYDAALYSAATMYVAQQAQTGAGAGAAAAVTTNTGTAKTTGSWQGYKKGPIPGGMKTMKPKQPPKPQQLHYCDVCKISCAGPQVNIKNYFSLV